MQELWEKLLFNFIKNLVFAHNFLLLLRGILSVVFVRDLNILVPHKLGNHFDVNAVCKQLAGKGTPQRVGRVLSGWVIPTAAQ